MRHTFFYPVILFALFLSISAHAETVVIDDAINHEALALKADRLLKDSCEQLMDCRHGVAPFDPQTMYTSAKGKANPDSMLQSNLDTSKLKARFAKTADESVYSEQSKFAVWADSAKTRDPATGAFMAHYVTQTDLVNYAIRAEHVGKGRYAQSANASAGDPNKYDAIFLYQLNEDGEIGLRTEQRLYAYRPDTTNTNSFANWGCSGSCGGLGAPQEAIYVREAGMYDTQMGEWLPWAETSQGAVGIDNRAY